jgi:putative spermidine/putrescine transport system substrate-binding protein
MMHAEAENPNCAYMWMEHTLASNLQSDLAAWFGSNPVVPAACQGSTLLGPDGCKTNGFEDFDRIRFWQTPVSKCGSQGECVPYYRWVSDYIGVIGGR